MEHLYLVDDNSMYGLEIHLPFELEDLYLVILDLHQLLSNLSLNSYLDRK